MVISSGAHMDGADAFDDAGDASDGSARAAGPMSSNMKLETLQSRRESVEHAVGMLSKVLAQQRSAELGVDTHVDVHR